MTTRPPRMRDDPTVRQGLRDLLGRAEQAPLPPIDVRAGLSRIHAAIDGGPAGSPGAPGGHGPIGGPSGAPAAPAGGSSLATLGSTMAGAIGIGVGAGVVVVCLFLLLASGPRDEQARSAIHPAIAISPVLPSAARPAASRPTTEAGPSSSEAASSLAAPEAIAPAPTTAPPRAAISAAPDDAPSASHSMAPAGAVDTGDAEIEHLNRLRASPPDKVVERADEGYRLFPNGAFGQEREYLAIKALFDLGRREEAVARGRAFLSRHSTGLYAERVRALMPQE